LCGWPFSPLLRRLTIEAVDARENQVVILGEEVVKPLDTAPNAGKTVHRRFTDVDGEADGPRSYAAVVWAAKGIAPPNEDAGDRR